MRTPIHAAAAAAAIALAAAFTSGCQNDLDPLAPKDGIIALTANPSTVVLDQNVPYAPRDPETGQLTGSTNIQAQVFDKDGHPLGGTAVFFTTSAGRLRSAAAPGAPPNGVITDASGVATDVLTVKESNGSTDPAHPADPITVTATSALVVKTVDVKVSIRDCANAAPVTNAGPDQTQVGGVLATTVILDGRGTTDAETPNVQLLFLWSCGNGTSPYPVPDDPTLEALFPQVVACDYESSSGAGNAEYVASLTVTDLGNGILDPNTGDYRCRKTATDTVTITIE